MKIRISFVAMVALRVCPVVSVTLNPEGLARDDDMFIQNSWVWAELSSVEE